MSAPAYLLPKGRPKAPRWVIGDPDEYLSAREESRFTTGPELLRYQQTSGGGGVLEGVAVPYLQRRSAPRARGIS